MHGVSRTACEAVETKHPELQRDDKSAWAKLKGSNGRCYRQLSDPVRRVESTVACVGLEPVDPPRGSIVAVLHLEGEADLEAYDRLLSAVCGRAAEAPVEATSSEPATTKVEYDPNWSLSPETERYVQESIARFDVWEREERPRKEARQRALGMIP
jgi:hypothetical protein